MEAMSAAYELRRCDGYFERYLRGQCVGIDGTVLAWSLMPCDALAQICGIARERARPARAPRARPEIATYSRPGATPSTEARAASFSCSVRAELESSTSSTLEEGPFPCR
jgi:hypothetical protein